MGDQRFDGAALPDPLVGEVRAVRTFRLHRYGLRSVTAGLVWTDGPNTATCSEDHTPAAPGCHCGFWAYGSEAAADAQPGSRDVLAVVACWGRIVPGTLGIRAQHARIEAMWLSPTLPPETVEALRQRYPGVIVYRGRDRMLAAHPPTQLECYRHDALTPPPRPLAHRLARVGGMIAAAAVAAGALAPRAVLGGPATAALGSALGWLLVPLPWLLVALLAVVAWLLLYRFASIEPERRHLVFTTAACSVLWLGAIPYSPPVQVFLRGPLLLWLLVLAMRGTSRR